MEQQQNPNNLKEVRERAGLSQKETAMRCGWHKSQQLKLEHGEIELKAYQLLKLSEVLHCTPNDILPGYGDKAIHTEQEAALVRLMRGMTDADRATLLKVGDSLKKSGELGEMRPARVA